ncbi:hypothetical protein CPAV1605_112 [seawater metagenome]|uniref:Uncharacterized protein n=1 Tax=seawater metagenome TaxID=1561972 RepID=A0A5E8CLR4_9ZZZZ
MEVINSKAKYVFFCDAPYEDFPNLKNISDLSEYVKEYNFGDLVSFSDYRDTHTYIIGKNGKLIGNPDYSAAGYLSIPYEITKYLTNSVERYIHSDLCVSDVALRFNDDFIVNNLNTKSCKILKKWNWKISYCETDTVFIKFPNGKGNHFSLSDYNSEKILEWYQNSEKEQEKMTVDFRIEGTKYDLFLEKYGKDNYKWLHAKPLIPVTWSVESGSGGGGSKSHHERKYYTGPKESSQQVIKSIQDFYEGFDYTIN